MAKNPAIARIDKAAEAKIRADIARNRGLLRAELARRKGVGGRWASFNAQTGEVVWAV